MPNTKLTRERLKVHFHYSRMIYLIVVVLAVQSGVHDDGIPRAQRAPRRY